MTLPPSTSKLSSSIAKASGDLAKYRIVHFATHSALAGQISGNSEPGLLLTPPAAPSAEDDGYLTASEIAGLKLDADWVILSACNTAAGGVEGAKGGVQAHPAFWAPFVVVGEGGAVR